MRVVIVGGAGFIGTALADRLSGRGDDVLVADTRRRLDRAQAWLPAVETREFDFVSGDDPHPLLEGADTVVHLACATTPASSMQSIAGDALRNILPSIRLFDAARSASVRRLVFSSSGGTVYGAPSRLPVQECDTGTPLSAYGVSKMAIEHYLSLYPALSPLSLRVANPYGAYQLQGAAVGVIARYARAAAAGEPIEVWGDGAIVRDYIAIEDVARAFELAVAGDLAPGAYNVGTGTGASLNEIIAMIESLSGHPLEVRRSPARQYDVPGIVLDPGKFARATGWTPRLGLRDGVARLLAAARAQAG
ncbi:NAD-dependent epimerase/dehydratase family protein [Luteimonas wenzhouensis]|nr:NAD-dependent epimerase/dehydratase family protein [Luteimonas wenzhouensis]